MRYHGDVAHLDQVLGRGHLVGSGDWKYSRRTLCERVALRAAGRQIGLHRIRRAHGLGRYPRAPREHFRRAGRNRKAFYYRRARDLNRVATFFNDQRRAAEENSITQQQP